MHAVVPQQVHRHRPPEVRVLVLTGFTLLLVVTTLGALQFGGLTAGSGFFRQRTSLWLTAPAAVICGLVLLLTLDGLRSRVVGGKAGLVAALSLLLPPVLAVQRDASGEANDFGGCGTWLDPQAIATPIGAGGAGPRIRAERAAECRVALDKQRTIVVLLAAPGALVAALSLLHLAGRRLGGPPD